MRAGQVEVDHKAHGDMFFWHYEARNIGSRDRMVIWLNGGPGCSSTNGALMEIGPYRVREGGELEYNSGSWDRYANLLFVDNPIGTGFSHVDESGLVAELEDMAAEMVLFLEKWFALFPEFESNDLYFAGESYAGQHIPYIAQAILERNKNPLNHPWSLNGLLIGNGWVAPEEQSVAILQYAYENHVLERDSPGALEVEAQQDICFQWLANGGTDHIETGHCEQILREIFRVTMDPSQPNSTQCINMYDIRKRDSYPACGGSYPPDLRAVTSYLRRPDVLSALHVDVEPEAAWSECTASVGNTFRARNSRPSIQFLPELLEQVPVVLYSGDQDMICNHLGTEAFIANMEWNGAVGFDSSDDLGSDGASTPQEWIFEGESAGWYQHARNLTYVLFYNASHMTPYDYPARSRNMLERFMGVDVASIDGTPSATELDAMRKELKTGVGGFPIGEMVDNERELFFEQVRLQLKGMQNSDVFRSKWERIYQGVVVTVAVFAVALGLWAWYYLVDQWTAKMRVGNAKFMATDQEVSIRDVENGVLDESKKEPGPSNRRFSNRSTASTLGVGTSYEEEGLLGK
ncbi:Cell death protease [Agyrium rufum]|nr:Cell death protease [Agyrium rufum]